MTCPTDSNIVYKMRVIDNCLCCNNLKNVSDDKYACIVNTGIEAGESGCWDIYICDAFEVKNGK